MTTFHKLRFVAGSKPLNIIHSKYNSLAFQKMNAKQTCRWFIQEDNTQISDHGQTCTQFPFVATTEKKTENCIP